LNEETGKWVYGWYTKLVEGIRRFDAIISDVDGELTRFYINTKETIGQFTGLHDKNGKEIYEGDIVSAEWTSPGYEEEDDSIPWIGDVVYSDCSYHIHQNKDEYAPTLSNCCIVSIEVIGNIHE